VATLPLLQPTGVGWDLNWLLIFTSASLGGKFLPIADQLGQRCVKGIGICSPYVSVSGSCLNNVANERFFGALYSFLSFDCKYSTSEQAKMECRAGGRPHCHPHCTGIPSVRCSKYSASMRHSLSRIDQQVKTEHVRAKVSGSSADRPQTGLATLTSS